MSVVEEAWGRRAAAWVLVGLVGLSSLMAGQPAHAQSAAGEVDFARGAGFAQQPGQTPRTLGKGLPLLEGDRLSTGAAAFAIIKLQDGTRMTLRPNTDLLLQTYRFREAAPDNSMVMQLFRGGFRAITGLINKNAPNAAQVQTATATIGIRGTDFDARLCGRDCQDESRLIPQLVKPNSVQASAKVAVMQGDVFAQDAAGTRRRLVAGGAVYPGDLVETGARTFALLAFRDQSRAALGSNSRLQIENFVYDARNPGEGSFLVRLARGSMRAVTGLIGKANPARVAVGTATATIGIRGTGFDLTCTGPCAGEEGTPDTGFSLFTWEGTVAVTPGGRGEELVGQGQGIFISGELVRRLSAAPEIDAPRPDDVPVDEEALFTAAPVGDDPDGLYVFVREGHVEIRTATEVLHLGRGEAGYVSGSGETTRPSDLPLFIEFDRTPMPDTDNPALSLLLQELLPRGTEVCR